MKGVIRYVYRRDRLRNREERFRYKHIVRRIRNTKRFPDIQTTPPKWRNFSHRWATGRTWKLYKGVARVDHHDADVYSWAFDDSPPLVWGYHYVHPYRSDDLSAWTWLHLSDIPDMGRFVNPLYCDASCLIRKHLTEKEYGTLFDDLIDGRCPECFYSLDEYSCNYCGWE